MTVLLDTNVVLEHLNSSSSTLVLYERDFAISVITETEILRYPGLEAAELEAIEQFLAITLIIGIDSSIARRAAALGRTRKTKLPDLLIAATALQFGLPLITRNAKDFKNIPQLIVRRKP